MATAAEACARQFAALSVADPSGPDDAAATPASSSSSPRGEESHGGEPPKKAPGSFTSGHPDEDEVFFMGEPLSSWPVPSRVAPSRQKLPQRCRKEAPSSRGPSDTPVSAVTLPSPTESVFSGVDAVVASPVAGSPVRPQKKQEEEEETVEASVQQSDSASMGTTMTGSPPVRDNHNPTASCPPVRPSMQRPQQRPPVQNGYRGKNQQPPPSCQYHNHGRRQKGAFPPRQPAQVYFNGNRHRRTMAGHLNPMPNLQSWNPNPRFAPPPPYTNTQVAPLGTSAPPHGHVLVAPPLRPPPLAQNPRLATPLHPPPAQAALLTPSDDLPLPLEQQHHPPPQHGASVDSRLRKQVEYYFSYQNLVKDVYLRRQMDNEGWVSAQTIASFPRVRNLTGDVCRVLEALRTSTVVEVSVDKMRRRGEWSRWLLPG